MGVERLASSLGLQFSDQGLLQQALVHRSFINEQNGTPLESYERMEFLGDAVLELVISTELYQQLPQLPEGELTKIRSSLVCGESLAKATQSLELGSFLLLGRGEEASGGRQRESILAAAFEALVAAIYLDQGYTQAQEFILKALQPDLAVLYQKGASPDNPKSMLQEHVQGQGRPAPRYQLVSSEGPDHSPIFTVEVLVGDEVMGTGNGGKKADAERAAARDALSRSGILQ